MRWFIRQGLRVLMYHRVSTGDVDELTVTTAQLAEQLAWLQAEGFTFVTLEQVLRTLDGGTLPEWPVLVTFDDAYLDTFVLAQPVLAGRRVPATLFVPSAFIGGASSWDTVSYPLMSPEQLRTLAAAGWSIALHSHHHRNFAQLAPEEAAEEVRQNISALRDWGIEPAPALAFPYGGRPHALSDRARMIQALRAAGVRMAFRIGNRINRLPVQETCELNRLGVRGDASFDAFQRKARWGRVF